MAATGTRRSNAAANTGETPAVDPDKTIVDVPSVQHRPFDVGVVVLSPEDVEYLVGNLLAIADDMRADLAAPGSVHRPDAFMRVDLAARVTSLASIVLQRRGDPA